MFINSIADQISKAYTLVPGKNQWKRNMPAAEYQPHTGPGSTLIQLPASEFLENVSQGLYNYEMKPGEAR